MPNQFLAHSLLLAGALLLCAGRAAQANGFEDANRLFTEGQQSQALEKVDAYLASQPKDAQALFLKGLILTKQSNTSEAIKIFMALTEDYPKLPEPYNNLAVLYAGQGQYEKAMQALEKAIRIHPGYATAHENLGDLYAYRAEEAYERASKLDRSDPTAGAKLAVIKELFARTARGRPPTKPSTTGR